MAYVTKKDQRGYIDFHNLFVDYSDGEVAVFDRVKDFARLYPLKPMDNLILLCTSGKLTVKLLSNSYELQEGDVVICPPKLSMNDAILSDDFECKAIRISDHITQALLRKKIDIWHHAVYVNQVNVVKLSEVNKEEIGCYFSLISSKLRNIDIEAHYEILLTLIRALMLEICLVLESNNDLVIEQKLSQGKVLFNRFLNLLSNSDVKRQPISYYAGKLAITPKYLTMLCQKYSNKTASDWVIQYTTEEIRFYLKSTDMSIKEVSAKLGFSNMSHFGSYVRKHLGISPSEFRYSKKI